MRYDRRIPPQEYDFESEPYEHKDEGDFGEFEDEYGIGELDEHESESETPFDEFEDEYREGESDYEDREAFEYESPVSFERAPPARAKKAPECPPKSKPVDCPRPKTQPTSVLDYFDFDKWNLKPGCHDLMIDEIVRRIIQTQGTPQPIRSVLIAGHTDKVGDDDHNFELGRKRATTVLNRLCAKLHDGLPGLAEKIEWQLTTCGDRQLKGTPELSRRVEVFLPAPPRPKGCPPFKERIRLHIKILVKPARHSIAAMLDAMRQVYEPAGFLIEVVTCEVLKLPDLEVPSIACPDPDPKVCHHMPCATTNISAELAELYTHRHSVEENELAVYFVRQTDPGMQGLCDHPRGQPGVVVTGNASLWTMAHEIGHVLGLSHVTSNLRLMFNGGTDHIQNLPPDLTATEIATMVASALTIPC